MSEGVRRFFEIQSGFEQALREIGSTREAAMQWVLKFVDKETVIDTIDHTEFNRLAHRVAAFASAKWHAENYPLWRIDTRERYHKVEQGQIFHNIPEREAVIALQDLARKYVERFFANRVIVFEATKAIFYATKMPKRGLFWIEAERSQAFTIQLILLLSQQVGSRLRRCEAEKCAKIFLSPRRRFCTDQCQRRNRIRRFRAKHPDRKKHMGQQPKQSSRHGRRAQ